MSAFRPGDRVIFTGTHPWAGQAGTIDRPFPAGTGMDLDWIVRLDGGDFEPGAAECDLLPLRDATR